MANRDDHTVSVVNIKNFQVEKVLKAGKRPFAVALSPDNNFLYVANVKSNDVSVFDTKNYKKITH